MEPAILTVSPRFVVLVTRKMIEMEELVGQLVGVVVVVGPWCC